MHIELELGWGHYGPTAPAVPYDWSHPYHPEIASLVKLGYFRKMYVQAPKWTLKTSL